MKLIFATLGSLAAAGCAPLVSLPAGAFDAAANPPVVGPAPNGPTVVYTPHRVEEPADWRDLNAAQGGGHP